mmetsp:Transcript_139917/g.390013  ORF Transcript_139917/g.390013 Transcript_139917/m.390013 type:complete len:210 (+) Transcript_139917:429-1058(+)
MVPCLQAVRFAAQHGVPAEGLAAAAAARDLGEGLPRRRLRACRRRQRAVQCVLVRLAAMVLQQANLHLYPLKRRMCSPDPSAASSSAVSVEVDESSWRVELHFAEGQGLEAIVIHAGGRGQRLLGHRHPDLLRGGLLRHPAAQVLQEALQCRASEGCSGSRSGHLLGDGSWRLCRSFRGRRLWQGVLSHVLHVPCRRGFQIALPGTPTL